MLQLFGLNNIWFGSEAANLDYWVISIHLEWNVFFLVGEGLGLSMELHDRELGPCKGFLARGSNKD